MTEEEINTFEKIEGQLESLHQEITNLSKKSQNDGLNKFKLKFVNKAISEANSLLGQKYKPFDDFDLFDENDIPSNSDVTMILGQYLNCLEKLRSDNIIQEGVRWFWIAGKKTSSIRTSPPRKILEK